MKSLAFCALCFFLSASSFAQVESLTSGQVYPVKIETTDGVTFKGFVTYISKPALQKEIYLMKEQTTPRKEWELFKPAEVKYFELGSLVFYSVPYSDDILENKKGVHHFLLLDKDGPIATYFWYLEQPQGSTDSYPVFKNPQGVFHPMDYFAMKFGTKMSEFIADDVELATKVKNGEKGYGLMKIYDIIDEYNKWYLENHK